jgi:peptidoglycan/LPS O-acetylase OafA/YrhL
MQAVERGPRCIFEPEAICFDDPSRDVATEQVRKRRTISGAIQLMLLSPRWLLPWKNPIWWQFVSHKILRLFSPFFLIGLLVASFALAHCPLYLAALALQLLGYASAAIGWVAERNSLRTRLLAAPLVFAALNVTTLAAWADAIRGRFAAAWQKT